MKLAIAIVSLFTVSAFAAGPEIGMTPPYWDSVSRIKTVLEADGLDLGEQITNIKAINDLKFEVSSDSCVQTVTLKVHPSNGLIGPAAYGIKSVSRVSCN